MGWLVAGLHYNDEQSEQISTAVRKIRKPRSGKTGQLTLAPVFVFEFERQVLQRSLNVSYLKNRFIYEIS